MQSSLSHGTRWENVTFLPSADFKSSKSDDSSIFDLLHFIKMYVLMTNEEVLSYLWEKGFLEQSCTFLLKVVLFFRLISMHQLETTLLHLTWVAWVKAKFGSMVNTLADTGQLTRLMEIAARAAMVVPIVRRSARPTVGTPARNGTSLILAGLSIQ